MANTPEHYLKLLVGDLAAQIAFLRAENEALREQLALRPPVVMVPTAPDAQAPA